MNAKDEMKAQIGLYRNVLHVGGRGYGKTLLAAQIANPEAPTVEELQNAIPLEGVSDISFAPGDDVTVYSDTNYTAQMSFDLDYVISHEEMRRNILGRWAYTPADELLNRLNTRLQGKDPGLPVNTRYWRDWK